MTISDALVGAVTHLRRRPGRAVLAPTAVLAGVAMAGLAALADAKTPPTVSVAANSALSETIVVDSHGLTLYELRPETTRHLLCTKANGCFASWHPVTVASIRTKLTTGHGVPGRLAILSRNGLHQLTLAGHPLYRFVGDGSHKGATSGQGLRSFGGTWHVVAVPGTSHQPVSTTPTTTPTTPSAPTTPTTPTVPYYPY